MQSPTNYYLPKRTSIYYLGILTVSLIGCAKIPAAYTTTTAQVSVCTEDGANFACEIPNARQAHLPQVVGVMDFSSSLRTGCQCIRNHLGSRFPTLEARPPMLALADPATMKQDANLSVRVAAAAKAEQDQAPQRVKAIKFLARLGCGKCFPDTERALLVAMDDCNESVRFASVTAIRDALGGSCQICMRGECYSQKISEKLLDIAYGLDNCGSHLEHSARVRRIARLALCACGPSRPTSITAIDEQWDSPALAETDDL